jgi:hypothetical protein
LNLYLLPGLGADERIFRHLELGDHNVVPIRWAVPLKHESIEDYALQIAKQIGPDNSVLIGMSFGGIMAIEIAKIISVSSVISYDELPPMYRLAGKLKLHQILTGGVLKSSQRMMNWVMGATDPLRKTLLADMLRDTDERFLHWGPTVPMK